jgi:23S rRNA (guanosine2251-2'-O)-methyltransferase
VRRAKPPPQRLPPRRQKNAPPPASGRERPEAAPRERPAGRHGESWLWGRHAVAAALANPRRRWHRLLVLPDERAAAEALAAAARSGEVAAVEVTDRAALNRLLPKGAVHQGWALSVEPLVPPDLDDILRDAATRPGRAVIVVLDRVGDPHNVGAVLRSAAAFGAAAVIVAEHGAPPATGVIAKAASGALDQVPLLRATNLARTLDRLKAAGFWCCGLDAAAAQPLAAVDPGPRVALVLGAEGGGLRRLVREECDWLVRLPTRPEQPSLNVSNAAAIALYELSRREASG